MDEESRFPQDAIDPPRTGRFHSLPSRSSLITFARESLKLGLALGLAFVLLAATVMAAMWGYSRHTTGLRAEDARRAERALEPLRKPKAWPVTQIVSGTRAAMQTKLGEGGVLVKLRLSDVPKGGLKFAQPARFILQFSDADGFSLLHHPVQAEELTTIVGDDGSAIGYEWNGSAPLPAESYVKAATWSVAWSGVSAADAEPRPALRDRWRSLEAWRRLRHGMNGNQVRKLLGDPTYVDAGGFTRWVYGGRNYVTHPHVEFYDGAVYGWKEP